MKIDDIVNCKSCNAIFHMVDGPYCHDCKEAEEQVFKVVKEYLYSNPRSDAKTISEDTGIPVTKILEFINEGRIGLIHEEEGENYEK